MAQNKNNVPAIISDILAQCKTNPNKVAIINTDGKETTYGDLLDIAQRTAGYIRSNGIQKDSFIVICMENCMEYIATELGAWLSGCAIAPTSPAYPKERIEYIKNHCEAKLVITEAILKEIRQAPKLDICEPTQKIAALFYTSGSTGAPKGVIHTFSTLSHNDHFSEFMEVKPTDCYATGAPLSFIACMIPIHILRNGACVKFISQDTMRDLSKIQKFIEDKSITLLFLSPSVIRQVSPGKNPNLRTIVTGTEKVYDIAPQGNYSIHNIYGMTETCCGITCFNITKTYSNTPIGKPLSDIEIKIMEDGEICLRGPLSPGYYKDPERSNQLWQDGWMHTGDLGRKLPDGNFEYINRKDWMVKINGQRVETGEISQVIKEVQGVKDAVAKGFTAPDGHQYIVAYYVAEPEVTEANIKDYLSKKLAPYMMPQCYVRMDALPCNMNGKLDIKSLRSPLDINAAREIAKPQTELQSTLVKAFETALGISPLGIDDDFFSFGGDSIRVMQLQRACPDLNLSSSLIYKARTVRRIVDELGATSSPKRTVQPENSVYPLSQTQKGIFAECIRRQGEAAYNNPLLYRIADGIDPQRLSESCASALKAHPNLFAEIFMDDSGEPMQRPGSSADFSIPVETLTDAQFTAERSKLIQPFNILKDRLFRVRIIKTESAVWLFADLHHLVFDGTSNGIILEDIEKAYAGQTVEPESYTGFDLALDEQAQRSTNELEECKTWNLNAFSEPDHTSIPDPDTFRDEIDFNKIETPTGISAASFTKAAELLGVTENVLATAAFGHMLGACTHSKSAAFATVYNGRKSLQTERTVSMMVKTLPVYCKWDFQTTVGDYLQQVGEGLIGAMSHDLYSFAEICSKTSYDSRVLFSYQDQLLECTTLCGRPCEFIPLIENATGEPLSVELYKKDGALQIRTEYRSNMYSQKYICAYIDCYRAILESLVSAQKKDLLSTIKLSGAEQESAALSTGRGIQLDFDRSDTFVTLFTKQVKLHPDATAVVDEAGSMTYNELDTASNAMAAALMENGVGKEDFVALMMPRRCIYPVSFIACFKCGAAYVPMDYEYPFDRLQYMLDDSGAKVLVTTRSIYENKKENGETLKCNKIIFADELPSKASAESIDKSAPEGLAYMIYTSGTTGKPKGVMIEHHSLANLVHFGAKEIGIGYGSRIAEHASFSFDGSVFDLMTPLCFGGQLHIIADSLRKDLAGLYKYFCQNKIDGVILTTQLGMTMLRMYNLKLKYLMVGGEKMSGAVKTDIKLYNAYGPTEFTVMSSTFLVDTDNIPENIPIGQALPNTTSAIVDSLGRLLPLGVPGELALIGVQLSRGYWNRAETTAQRFVACPFLPGEKMYRTGDLAKWSEDGQILYLGRIDTQVKLRGFRIELGEIDSTLLKFPGIKAAVTAVKEISGLQHLCAYYCSDSQIDSGKLREFLASSLTDYMVPTAYVQLDSMPMTPNGKVDLRSLPVPVIRAQEIVAPATPLEEKIFRICSEYLKNDAFGVTTNLISMGMTSLGAISISLLLEKNAGITIPSSKILEMPTIRQWTEFLGENAGAAKEEIPVYKKRTFYPMTENQTGIYLDWEKAKDSTQYNIPMLLHFSATPVETVVEAVKAFVNAHPYVKTKFKSQGTMVQLRCDSVEVEVPVKELSREPDQAFWMSQLKPFNLMEGQLCRLEVFYKGSDVWLLSDFHHTIFDGGSEAIFVQDIADFCNGKPIEEESFSAFDYSLYYEEWKSSEAFTKAGEYFKSLLSGVTAASLPSEGSTSAKGLASMDLTMDRGAVRERCKSEGVTENALFMSAVTEVLHRFIREDNLAILTVSNGRSLSALRHTCGLFVQTLPVVSHHTARTVSETLKSMQSQISSTLSNDKYPYTKIVEDNGIKPEILVAYQGDVLGDALTVNGKPLEMTGLATDTAKMPIAITITPSASSVELHFEYDSAIYQKEEMQRFASAVVTFAENLANSSSETELFNVPCVNSTTTSELVALGSGEHMDVDSSATIVTLVHRFATGNPADTAVVDSLGSISYKELDHSSDVLAGILMEAGVNKEDFVGLMLPRSKDFPIAFMAVYKAGGAYVPMDYEYPFERLQYMLENSEAKVLVTTREIYNQKLSEGELKAGKIIFMDELDLVSMPAEPVDNSTPDGLAYMIYTSGTTGKPKGVMIEHHALLNMMVWNSSLAKIGRGTHVAEHASFSFDASVLDTMTTLAYGGSLYIMPENCRKDPEVMDKYFRINKIEVTTMSTQMGMMMLSSYKLSIRHIMLGGEKLTGKYGKTPVVVNGYGPTEFTICSSYHIVDPENEAENIPIGRAVPNTISAIVDPCGQLMPRGAAGELVLIGPQIARGYWNKEDVTRKRFAPCPFVPGQKMYHTGDLARWNEDGELMFMGRIDTQVKLRGFRIEMGEIESVLSSFEGITACVAKVRALGGTDHLCAWYTASCSIDQTALRAHLSSRLTSYMVPDALMQMDALPLTPNGKVDTKQLPDPELAAKTSGNVFQAPEGEMEETVAGAFAKALGDSVRIGRDDSFFDIGGTSLLVMKVIVALADKGITVTYGDVFKYQTPRALAAFAQGLAEGASAAGGTAVASGQERDSGIIETGDDGYDYRAINKALENNTPEAVGDIAQLSANEIGDVLLLGSTGFLGIHILQKLLTEHDGKIWCVVRPRKGITCEGRLRSYLMYYFDQTWAEEFGKRLFVVEGDMTDDAVMAKLLELKVDTVINCAANVKHFAAGDEITKINLDGTLRLIDYCLKTGSRLIHTSTHSISGQMEGEAARTLAESNLYIGQKMVTKYQTSKFQAERAILEAVASKGLKAKIMRLGNLMPRFSDGEFQINLENNGFMARMRAYYLIGCIASSHLHASLEFAPIDETASAILTLARTPDKFTVFHPYNNHTIYIDDVVAIMRQCGLNIRIVNDAEFSEKLGVCLEDDHLNPFITTLLAYSSHNNFVVNPPSSDFTVHVLNSMDWRWPITGGRYLSDAFEKLESLEYFNK